MVTVAAVGIHPPALERIKVIASGESSNLPHHNVGMEPEASLQSPQDRIASGMAQDCQSGVWRKVTEFQRYPYSAEPAPPRDDSQLPNRSLYLLPLADSRPWLQELAFAKVGHGPVAEGS